MESTAPLLGVDGADGVLGAEGVEGADGTDGVLGTDGVDGTAGVDGTDGVEGTEGVEGRSLGADRSGAGGTFGTVAPPPSIPSARPTPPANATATTVAARTHLRIFLVVN